MSNWASLMIVFSMLSLTVMTQPLSSHEALNYIEVSRFNPAYFQYTHGEPYIPIGINLINPSGKWQNQPDSAKAEIETWMKNLAEHGGNYVRIWLSQSFWDMEEKQAGVYEPEKVQRIAWFITTARKNHLRIKMTLEHFRSLTMEENPQKWAVKSAYHRSQGGPLDDIRQYLSRPEGHQLFLNKIDFYQKQFGADTLFFGWELWNEMNAMKGPEEELFWTWNKKMLAEVKQRFPQQLVMQSLGSFDTEKVHDLYRQMMLLPANEVAQVHRYLDLGADLNLCQGPMDIICASAIEELRAYQPGKPILLAETGAVEPRHSGPSKFYALDTTGILLHDMLFAPFFSGAAGPGMSWHWESYVHKNNLWYHYKRFSQAIRGINPLMENFQPLKRENEFLRLYILAGRTTTLIWLRDKSSDWRSELDAGRAASVLTGLKLRWNDLQLPRGRIQIYNPWTDHWSPAGVQDQVITLPDFRRSLVIRIDH